jgi:hypothetical protein
MDAVLDTLLCLNSQLSHCPPPSWLVQCHHSVHMSKSSQKQKPNANNLISYLIWKDLLNQNVSNYSIRRLFGHQYRQQTEKFLCSFARHSRSQNFAAAPTHLRFSTSTIRNSPCTTSNLESNICFYLIFHSNIFNSSTVINGSFPINSPTLHYALFRPLGFNFFFLQGPQ